MYTVKRKRTLGIQTGVPLNEWKDNWMQTGVSVCGSYNRLGRQEKNFYHLRQLEGQYIVRHGYHIRMVKERRTDCS